MTKTHKITLVFAIIFLVLNILIINFHIRRSENDKTELENAIITETNCLNRLSILSNNFIYALESDDCFIDQNTYVIDLNGDTILLSKIIRTNKNYLIFRYSYSSCSNCISQITQLLYQYRDSLINTEILLLPHYLSYRDLVVQNSDTFNKAFRIFMPIKNQIGLPLDEKDLPYLFLIDDGKIAKHIFVADPSEIDLLKGYLKTISLKTNHIRNN